MALVRILGFDTGTANTAYSLIEGDPVLPIQPKLTDFGMIKTKKSDGASVRDRIDTIGLEVRKLIAVIEPTHIAIEDFTEQGKLVGKTYKEMAWLTEHLRLLIKELGYELNIFENGYWKKTTMKAMRASKEQVQHFVAHKVVGASELLGRQPNHVWDSVGIGYCKWVLLKEDRGKRK